MGSGQFLWWFLEKQKEVTLLTPRGFGAAERIKTDLDFYLLLFCFLAANSSDVESLIPGQARRDGAASATAALANVNELYLKKLMDGLGNWGGVE